MNINNRVESLVAEFKGMEDWEDRYKFIIQMGKMMDPMDDSLKNDNLKVKGCQSQVWLWPELKDGKIYFQADSDASIVRGLVAMLVKVYSGSTPDEILATKPTFLEEIGIREHLSMSRSSGLSSMLKQISMYAIAFKAKLSM
jgi:cysteine desulfuration protein SufE